MTRTEVSNTSYRCNLSGVFKYVKTLKLRECHKKVLKNTPFWKLFEAIIEDRFTSTQCRKNDKLIVKIITAYDPTRQKFQLGGKYVDLTSSDICRTFGISSGRELLSLKYISQNELEMGKRRALDKRLTTPSIKRWLKKLLRKNKKEDIEDVARFLCLYICHALFFPHATTIPWVYLARIEDFKKAMSYDWCGAIADDLLTSIKKYHQKPMKVTGCVVALQYWLCYHTNIVEANNPDASLGFIRWSLPTMISKFETLSLKDLLDDQVQLTIDDVGEPSTFFLEEIQQVVAQPVLKDSHDWLLKHLFYVVTDEDKKELHNGRRNEWELDDGKEVSNFLVDDYITILRSVMQQCHFYSPFTVENILAGRKVVGTNNISPETRKIFFPVLQDKHWMLLVVDCRKRELFWLDSLYPDENTPCAQKLAKWVRQNIKLETIEDEDWDMTLPASSCQNKLKMTCPLDSPIQNDGYNCGIYMIGFMVSLAVGDEIPRLTKDQANNMRMRITVELQMENLLPPFPGTNYQLLWERKRCDHNKLLIEYKRKVAECESLKSALHVEPESNVKILDLDSVEKTRKFPPQLYEENSTSDCFLQSSTNPPTVSGKKLLVLDVNGLLAHIERRKSGYGPNKFEVTLRPFCDKFLEFCFGNFRVAVWSSRTMENLNLVLERVMGNSQKELLFCWDQSKCTNTGATAVDREGKPLFLKELKRIWDQEDPSLPWKKGEYNKSNTLLLDDDPYKAYLNPDCTAIFPLSFKSNPDEYLKPGGGLWNYLSELAACEDVGTYIRQHPFGKRPEEDANWKFLANYLCKEHKMMETPEEKEKKCKEEQKKKEEEEKKKKKEEEENKKEREEEEKKTKKEEEEKKKEKETKTKERKRKNEVKALEEVEEKYGRVENMGKRKCQPRQRYSPS